MVIAKEVSSTLIDISGRDASGDVRELLSFIKPGRHALVWWHPQALTATACKSCGQANKLSEPVRLLEEIYAHGCDVIGLTYETPESVAEYLYSVGVEYPILSVDVAAAREHGAAKAAGEPWSSIPHRIAFLVNDRAQIINRYEVHDATAFLRIVRDDVKAGPPPSKWTPVTKRKKFLGIL